jgi:excisionase family DNA binding protein
MANKRLPIEARLQDRICVSINEVADLTSLGHRKIYELIRDGRLEIAKVGRRTLVKTDSLFRLLEVR